MRKPQCWFYGDLAERFHGGGWQRVEQVICDAFLVLPASDLGPCRGPRPTLQRATGHTRPGTSDNPIMTNRLSCRWTC